MAAATRIESILSKAGTIAVFSKSYCPYCVRAKGLLNSYGGIKSRLQVFELDQMGQEGVALQTALAKHLGKDRVTVPQVFIDSKHIGGCDDLQRAQSNGTLEEMLEKLQTSK